MALRFTSTLRPRATIYDCMDELSLFRGAPPELLKYEHALMSRCQLVFTGGYSLFEAKCEKHEHVHAFPSAVDVDHFATARQIRQGFDAQERDEQVRIGYAGVLDERMNLDLIEQVAAMQPDWHFMMLGPVVKIESKSLPQRPNIHYLGMKPYDDLPKHFARWNVALLPFALNDSTKFISPTKTPEYLAAGLPVVSTAVRDVVRTYGDFGMVRITSTAGEFCHAIEQCLNNAMSVKGRERVDNFLADVSWDKTWAAMNTLIEGLDDREEGVPERAAASAPAATLGEAVGV